MGTARSDTRGVIVPCPSCGTPNRIAFAALGQATRCARCHTAIGAPDLSVEVASADAFDALVGAACLPVLVDFWAEWCGPCRVVAPHVAAVARRTAGQVLVVKVDTEAASDLAARLGIRSIPTLAVYMQGREAARTAGAMSADQIEAFVRSAAAQS